MNCFSRINLALEQNCEINTLCEKPVSLVIKRRVIKENTVKLKKCSFYLLKSSAITDNYTITLGWLHIVKF